MGRSTPPPAPDAIPHKPAVNPPDLAEKVATTAAEEVQPDRPSTTGGPVPGDSTVDLSARQRRAGQRREVSERISILTVDGERLGEGWALNVSRGGVRAVVEFPVVLDATYDIILGEEGESPLSRRGRVAWIREAPDGMIVGIAFLSGAASAKSMATDLSESVGDLGAPPDSQP